MKPGQDMDTLSRELTAELKRLLGSGLRHRSLALRLPRLDYAAENLSSHPDRPMEGKLKDLLELAAQHMAERKRNAVAILLDFAPKAAEKPLLKARRLAAAEALGGENAEYFQKKLEAPLLNELTVCLVRLIADHDAIAADPPSFDQIGAAWATLDSEAPTAIERPAGPELDFRELKSTAALYLGKRLSDAKKRTIFWVILCCGVFVILGLLSELASWSPSEPKFREWGPQRETFTWNHRPNHGTIDSATNNPALGDETHFLSIESSHTDARNAIIVHHNERLTLRASFDNDAYTGSVSGVSVRFAFPRNTSSEQTVTAYFPSSTEPLIEDEERPIWANAYFFATSPFDVAYIDRTAKLWTPSLNGRTISDATSKAGAPLNCGTQSTGVVIAGCTGSVTVEVQVRFVG